MADLKDSSDLAFKEPGDLQAKGIVVKLAEQVRTKWMEFLKGEFEEILLEKQVHDAFATLEKQQLATSLRHSHTSPSDVNKRLDALRKQLLKKKEEETELTQRIVELREALHDTFVKISDTE